MSGKERLKSFLGQHCSKFIKTSEIAIWGANSGYSNRAMRNARQLAEDNFLERLTKTEAVLNGFNCSEGVYKIIG